MNIILLLVSIIALAVLLKFSLNIIIIVGVLLLGCFAYVKYFTKKGDVVDEEQSLEKK